MALAVLTLVRADGTGNGRAQLWKTGRVRVYIGADHAGYELKNHLVSWLKEHGHEVTDCGPSVYDAEDDYPAFCLRAAEGVAGDPGSLGIVIGGSGNGEQIAANKVRGIRAALAWSEETAQLAREHNNANVVSPRRAHAHRRGGHPASSRSSSAPPFSGSERHSRRIAQVAGLRDHRPASLAALAPLAAALWRRVLGISSRRGRRSAASCCSFVGRETSRARIAVIAVICKLCRAMSRTLRQKTRPAHGLGLHDMAVVSARTAPGVCSPSSPAPCSSISVPSPR